MKKLLFLTAFIISGMNLHSQNVSTTFSAGFPVGDASDFAWYGLNLDASYLFEVTELFDVGVTSGYHHYFEQNTGIGDFGFLPIAASSRINVSYEFRLGIDAGYAIGFSPDINDGGFYYAPSLQYKKIVLAYKVVKIENIDFGAVTLGIQYIF